MLIKLTIFAKSYNQILSKLSKQYDGSGTKIKLTKGIHLYPDNELISYENSEVMYRIRKSFNYIKVEVEVNIYIVKENDKYKHVSKYISKQRHIQSV